jgi:ElaB/YqjD/DUF883 family membrane-anchored ribosome-binding protein
MAEEPQVIQHELEETRHALAEKLEQIGEKISGTVETVSDTVNSVTETVTNMTEAMEGTVQAVAESVSDTVESVRETVTSVGDRAAETVEAVKEAFNFSEQFQRRPWLWVGGSLAVGFVAGKVFAPRTHHTPEAESFSRGHGYHEGQAKAEPTQAPRRDWSQSYEPAESQRQEERETGPAWVGSLMQQFGPEINKLKGLALGTVFGLVRDMVAQSVPETLKDQVTHLIDDVTEKVGGKPIQGQVLASFGEQDQSNQADGSTAERQGQTAGGRSNR